MSDFEYFFSFFGLLLGFTVAEVAIGFANAIDAHRHRPIGRLTPLLAVFVLLDISSFWVFTWSARDLIKINWLTLFGALVIALSYFLSAALVFPRRPEEWPSLDEHFWNRRRYVFCGIILANVVLRALQLTRALPRLTDFWFFFHNGSLLIIYAGLWFSRSRRLVMIFLGWAVLFHLLLMTGITPRSHWAHEVGLNEPTPAAAVPGARAAGR
jgi:hypothetical protein